MAIGPATPVLPEVMWWSTDNRSYSLEAVSMLTASSQPPHFKPHIKDYFHIVATPHPNLQRYADTPFENFCWTIRELLAGNL